MERTYLVRFLLLKRGWQERIRIVCAEWLLANLMKRELMMNLDWLNISIRCLVPILLLLSLTLIAVKPALAGPTASPTVEERRMVTMDEILAG